MSVGSSVSGKGNIQEMCKCGHQLVVGRDTVWPGVGVGARWVVWGAGAGGFLPIYDCPSARLTVFPLTAQPSTGVPG